VFWYLTPRFSGAQHREDVRWNRMFGTIAAVGKKDARACTAVLTEDELPLPLDHLVVLFEAVIPGLMFIRAVRCARVRVNRYRDRGHTTYPDRTAGLLGERFFAFIEEILVSPQPDSLSW